MKIKAFTLIEMLVGLLIGGLILGLAWNVYFYLGGYRQLIEDKAERQIELKKIEYWLRKDLKFSQMVRLDEGTLAIKLIDDSVQYQFNEEHLIRSSSDGRDTFEIKNTIQQLDNSGSYKVCLLQTIPNDYCFVVKLSKSSVGYIMETNENP